MFLSDVVELFEERAKIPMHPQTNWPSDESLQVPFDNKFLDELLVPHHLGKMAYIFYLKLVKTFPPLHQDNENHLLHFENNTILLWRITRDWKSWRNITCRKSIWFPLPDKIYREKYFCQISTAAVQLRKLRLKFINDKENCTIIIPLFSRNHALVLKYKYKADEESAQITVYNPTGR